MRIGRDEREQWDWLNQDLEGFGTLEVVLILVVLIALVIMFKDTVVDFVAGVLQSIESQSGNFDPTQIAM